MHSTYSTVTARRVRVAVAGLLTAGLLGGGAATVAVAAPQVPAPPQPAPVSSPASSPAQGEPADTDPITTPDHTDPAPAGPVAVSNHATADRKTVKAWQEFRIKGETKGIKPGSKVVLEQKQRGAWRALPARTSVSASGTYVLRVKLGLKGKNELRLLADGKPSNVVRVDVR